VISRALHDHRSMPKLPGRIGDPTARPQLDLVFTELKVGIHDDSVVMSRAPTEYPSPGPSIHKRPIPIDVQGLEIPMHLTVLREELCDGDTDRDQG